MLGVLKELRSLFALKGVITDNVIFRLHYRLTVMLLVGFSLIVTCRQYFGDPIYCLGFGDREVYSQSMINAYCWTSTTFTIVDDLSGKESLYPGVDTENGGPPTFHSYYQWVHIMLFIQAVLFYLPHLLWKTIEFGRLSRLVLDLQQAIVDPEMADSQYDLLTSYIISCKKSYNIYAISYSIFEALNLINVIGQIYLVDKFLGGEFTSYGIAVVNFLQMKVSDRMDPMKFVFPLMTKCGFKKIGPGGNTQYHDYVCLLPQNVLNEKLYVFLWFWFVFLAIASSVLLCYRIAVMTSKRLRVCVMCSRHRFTGSSLFSELVEKLPLGSWFIWYYLGKNLDVVHYRQMTLLLHEKVMAAAKTRPDIKPSQFKKKPDNLATFEYTDCRKSLSASALSEPRPGTAKQTTHF